MTPDLFLPEVGSYVKTFAAEPVTLPCRRYVSCGKELLCDRKVWQHDDIFIFSRQNNNHRKAWNRQIPVTNKEACCLPGCTILVCQFRRTSSQPLIIYTKKSCESRTPLSLPRPRGGSTPFPHSSTSLIHTVPGNILPPFLLDIIIIHSNRVFYSRQAILDT